MCMTGWYMMILHVSPDFVTQRSPNLESHVPANPRNVFTIPATPCKPTFFSVWRYIFCSCPMCFCFMPHLCFHPHSCCSNHPYSRKCTFPYDILLQIRLWPRKKNHVFLFKNSSGITSRSSLFEAYTNKISIQVIFSWHFNTFVVEVLFSATISNLKSPSHLGSRPDTCGPRRIPGGKLGEIWKRSLPAELLPCWLIKYCNPILGAEDCISGCDHPNFQRFNQKKFVLHHNFQPWYILNI